MVSSSKFQKKILESLPFKQLLLLINFKSYLYFLWMTPYHTFFSVIFPWNFWQNCSLWWDTPTFVFFCLFTGISLQVEQSLCHKKEISKSFVWRNSWRDLKIMVGIYNSCKYYCWNTLCSYTAKIVVAILSEISTRNL